MRVGNDEQAMKTTFKKIKKLLTNDKGCDMIFLVDDLKQILGIDIDQDVDVSTQISAKPVKIDMLTAINSALGSRLELRQREISRTELDIQMKQIKEMNSLDGNISLSLGVMGDNEELQKVYVMDIMMNFSKINMNYEIRNQIFDYLRFFTFFCYCE